MEETGIGYPLVYMFGTGIGNFLFILLIEYCHFHKCFSCPSPQLPPSAMAYNDNDVNEEKQNVGAMSLEDLKTYNVVLRNMSKFYGRFLAVNRISVRISRYILCQTVKTYFDIITN